MKRLAQIATLVVVALLSACNNKEVMRDTEPIYTPRYAQGFSIERDKASGEVLLCVKNPWQGAENIVYYTPINPEKPLQRVVAMSSSYVAMLDAVGCTECIVGISGCRFISTPSACKAVEEGKIAEVGYDSTFDFERIKSLNADAVLLYGIAGEAKGFTNKLDELGIPYVYIGDYLETSPLGKAEWVVALSYLCGVEEQGKEFFEGVESRYIALSNRGYDTWRRPKVMLNIPYRDTWFLPPRNSYMVQLIEDAGGRCLLPNDVDETSTISKPISLEEAIWLVTRADYWLNLGQITSLEELKAIVPHFAEIDVVRWGNLYNNTKRTNPSRGSDFWESGAVRPDLILADLVNIFHYSTNEGELYYYKKME